MQEPGSQRHMCSRHRHEQADRHPQWHIAEHERWVAGNVGRKEAVHTRRPHAQLRALAAAAAAAAQLRTFTSVSSSAGFVMPLSLAALIASPGGGGRGTHAAFS